MADYIPTTDEGVRSWAENFAALITADPQRYGLVADDATAIQAASDDYAASLATALNPGTRTPVTVAEKDARRAQLVGLVRPYAIQIKFNLLYL